MNAGTWVAIYLPIFLLLFVFLPQQAQHKKIAAKIRKKRGAAAMANELIKKYVGKTCIVYSGSFGGNTTGLISTVEDNWIEIETKKGPQLINADFVTNITEISEKKK